MVKLCENYEELEDWQKLITVEGKLQELASRRVFIEEEISAKQDQLTNLEVDYYEAMKELDKIDIKKVNAERIKAAKAANPLQK